MAIETLSGVLKINNARVMTNEDRPKNEDGSVKWGAFDEMRKAYPICVDHNQNMISFKIQYGPIKENGVNGCQVEDMIATCKHIVEGLNEKFPCMENNRVIAGLEDAVKWSKLRTENRIERGVEGENKI